MSKSFAEMEAIIQRNLDALEALRLQSEAQARAQLLFDQQLKAAQLEQQANWKAIEKSFKETGDRFKETEARFQETDAKFKETDAKFKETDAKFKETDAKFKETDARIKAAFDLFEGQWGKLMESLVEGDLVNILNARGIPVNRTSTRVKGRSGEDHYEFDIIAHNGDSIVVVEVKTTLRVKHVKAFLQKIKKVKTWLREYEDFKVYGAMAYLRSEENSDSFAEGERFFVIRATGDSAAIMNKPDFTPKAY